MKKIKLFYRFGATAEKNLFKEMLNYYDGIVINAHFFALFDSMVPSLLKKIEKPFFFDPKTYIFGRNLECFQEDSEEMSDSLIELRKYYGETLRNITKNRRLLPKDFKEQGDFNTQFLEEFVKRVLTFQEDLYPLTNTQKSLENYSKVLNKDLIKRKQPVFLVAPYFYFETLKDPWYSISLQLAKKSTNKRPDKKVFVPICTSQELLSHSKMVKKVIKDYKEFDGFLIWISNLNESECSTTQLKHFKHFIQELGKIGKPIYNLYGSFYSAFFNKYGMTGIVRGINYGSHRKVDRPSSEIGGWPTRYFLPFLEIFTSDDVANTFYADHPNRLCNCQICSSIKKKITQERNLQGKPLVEAFFREIGISETRKHFMATYHNEIQTFSQLPLKEVSKKLEEKYEKGKELLQDYGFPRAHLKRWKEALKSS